MFMHTEGAGCEHTEGAHARQSPLSDFDTDSFPDFPQNAPSSLPDSVQLYPHGLALPSVLATSPALTSQIPQLRGFARAFRDSRNR